MLIEKKQSCYSMKGKERAPDLFYKVKCTEEDNTMGKTEWKRQSKEGRLRRIRNKLVETIIKAKKGETSNQENTKSLGEYIRLVSKQTNKQKREAGGWWWGTRENELVLVEKE